MERSVQRDGSGHPDHLAVHGGMHIIYTPLHYTNQNPVMHPGSRMLTWKWTHWLVYYIWLDWQWCKQKKLNGHLMIYANQLNGSKKTESVISVHALFSGSDKETLVCSPLNDSNKSIMLQSKVSWTWVIISQNICSNWPRFFDYQNYIIRSTWPWLPSDKLFIFLPWSVWPWISWSRWLMRSVW